MKPYRKIYYTDQLRVFETDTKYKTIWLNMIVGEPVLDSTTTAVLAQGQVDLINFFEAFSDLSLIYSDDYQLTARVFRWSYSISFVLTLSAPTITFLINQFLEDYGFDTENFLYLYRFIDLEDLWYIVRYHSNREFFSLVHSAKIILNYCTSQFNFKINFLYFGISFIYIYI